MNTHSLFPRVVTASMIGAAVLVGGVASSVAQSPSANPPSVASATSSKPETVEQRIAELKTAPDQDAKWSKVADAMRDNAAQMGELVKKTQTNMTNMTAIDNLRAYRDFTRAHLEGLKKVVDAFDTLYDSMPDAQKKNADQVFENFGPSGEKTKTPSQG